MVLPLDAPGTVDQIRVGEEPLMPVPLNRGEDIKAEGMVIQAANYILAIWGTIRRHSALEKWNRQDVLCVDSNQTRVNPGQQLVHFQEISDLLILFGLIDKLSLLLGRLSSIECQP